MYVIRLISDWCQMAYQIVFWLEHSASKTFEQLNPDHTCVYKMFRYGVTFQEYVLDMTQRRV